MAIEPPTEHQGHVIDPSEQTPLLGSGHRVDEETGQQADTLEPSGVLQQPSHPPDEIEPQTRNTSWYIWRIFWSILAIAALALFIKGWIDAGGDVDVNTTREEIPNLLLPFANHHLFFSLV